MMDVLRVEELCKNFGGIEALKKVTFSVKTGEKLAIIGPNGAGKTTLLNLINGQIRSDYGKIFYKGKDITNLPIHKRALLGISRAFQTSTLIPSMSALTNLLLSIHGKKSSRLNIFRKFNSYDEYIVEAEKYLRLVSLLEKRFHPVSDLAHGEQRKLEIAMSLASEPKLLLLDEPSAGLTAAESSEVASIIKSLDPNITIIVVAHDMDLIFGLADRIIVLHYGEILCEGLPGEIQCDRRVREIYMGFEESEYNA